MRKKYFRRGHVSIWTYVIVIAIGVVMMYPIIWMFFATRSEEHTSELQSPS